MDDKSKQRTPPSHRVKRVYITALAIIAILSISEQLLVQLSLSISKEDATTINLAGRQRMLSQNITKDLVLVATDNITQAEERKKSLAANFQLFKLSHEQLKKPMAELSDTPSSSDSKVIQILLQDIDDEIEEFKNYVNIALRATLDPPSDGEKPALLTDQQFKDLLSLEKKFLIKMDNIVSQYESEAYARFNSLKQLEIVLLIVILITLLLEARFIFAPLAKDLDRFFAGFKKTEDKLKESNLSLEGKVIERTALVKEALARLEAILDNAADAIISIDVDGRILSFNKAATAIFGYEENEIFGQSVDRLIPDSQMLNHKEIISNYQKTGVSKIIGIGRQVVGKTKSGREFPLHLAVSKINTFQGKVFTGILRDISLEERLKEERKKAVEHALDAAQLRSDMFAYMSHEIRTPLNGVIGMLGLIDKNQLQEEQSRRITLAESSAKTLLTVVNDNLDYSKMDADKLVLEQTKFDLHKLLDELAHLAAPRAHDAGVDLILDLTNLPALFVKGDPIRLRQIINNLLNNALKFTHQGSITIICSQELEAKDSEESKSYIHCSVIDTGIGIPVSKLKNLFSPFVQTDSDTTRKYGGTGLGLAIVKQLCNRMDGDISVISEEARGSNFTFRIPLTFTNESNLFSQTNKERPLTGKHIAIIQSDSLSRNLTARQLFLWGATVSCKNTAKETLTWIRQAQSISRELNPDLFIIDQQLPDCAGTELGDRLGQIKFSHRPPLLLQSYLVSIPSPVSLAKHYFASVLLKPITATNLANQIEQQLFKTPKITDALYENTGETTIKKSIHPTNGTLERPASTSNRNLKILLVEDNWINQEVACGLLTNFGMNATLATDGANALAILRESTDEKYDLIVTDCLMPVLDGYGLTREIRAGSAGEQYLKVPIIALTASTMAGDREKCANVGMNEFVSKPIEASSLYAAMKRCLPDLSDKMDIIGKASSNELANTEAPQKLPADNAEYIEVLINASWNREDFIRRIGDDAGRIIKLIQVILDQLPQNLSELAKAIEAKDWEQAKISAHTIKGNSANLGATHASMTAMAMEFTAAKGDRSKLSDLFNVLESDIKIVEQLLEQEISLQEQRQAQNQ